MLLKNLIKNIPKNKRNIFVSGLSTDSRKVKKNYIFFAIKGNNLNGEIYINQAIKKGASIIVCSKNCKYDFKNIYMIRTSNIRVLLSEISSKFYKEKPKNIFAVTGTNGKTSVADLFYQILRINNIPAASIGTLGVKYNDHIIKTDLTSPDTIELHKYLNFLKKKKIDNVIVEASSHGLDQKRLHNIKFKAGIFTNFSQDHLDYHKNMRLYLNAKLILFKKILKKNSSVISDDKIPQFKILKKISKARNLKILNIKKGVKKIESFSQSFNDFKIKNLAMAIEAIKLCGLKNENIYRSLKKLKEVNGRLELIKSYSNNIKVFIDYAHTPDALFTALKYLKHNYGNNISLVFGCGGDRDKKKRPLMARIANTICKKIYITDDNPRNENPNKIRNELSKYISKDKIFNIGNRALAIKKAISNSKPQELILIAGKGHEEKQIYKNKIKVISDKKIIKKIKKKDLNSKNLKDNFFQNNLILNKILKKNLKINFDGFSIDTRSLKKDDLFLAIKGKKNDGNKFISEALKHKAGCVVTSIRKKKKNRKIIKVKNSISFLNSFAKYKRAHTTSKVISITGSAGKTSLKNLLKELLETFGKTYSSPKSFNNRIGVPISLSNLSTNDKFGVFEVGMSKAGEIKKLTKLIKPHIGVITNIGEAHLENFKNIAGIAEAKSEIIENIESGGTIILNRDDKFFYKLNKKAKAHQLKVISFGKNKKSDICAQKFTRKANFSHVLIKAKDNKLSLKIKDLNIYNLLASIAVLTELKLNIQIIKYKLKYIEPSEGRGKLHSVYRYKKAFKFIDESYNANPLSVRNAIKKFNSIKNKKIKKYLILGDMLELGSKSKKYHEQLSKVINKTNINKVLVKGKKTIFTYKHLNKEKRGNILQNSEDIDIYLSKMISNNDYLMIKGSNATGLNDFSEKMIKGR